MPKQTSTPERRSVFDPYLYTSADGTRRCVRCGLHAPDCTCGPETQRRLLTALGIMEKCHA